MMPLLLFFSRRLLVGLFGLALLLSSSRAAAQIGNDDCTQAATVSVIASCSLPLNGTVQGATQSLPPTAACGFNVTSANDVWYTFVATGTSHQITLAPRFAAIMDIRSGTCAASTSVFCTAVASGNVNATLVGGLTNGQPYFIRIYASGGVPPAGISSTFALCISPSSVAPANDDCSGAIAVPVQPGGVCTTQTSADNTAATNSIGVPAPTCGGYQGKDIWFSVTVPASGALTVQTVIPTAGSNIVDTGMSIYSGTCGNLLQVGCDDDGAGGTKSLLNITGRTPGEVLYVRVWAFNNQQTGLIALCAVAATAATNDDCANAVAVPVTTACTSPTAATVAGASQSLPPSTGCGFATTANDVWFSFVASGATQTVTFTGNFGAVLDVRSGTCTASTSVFCSTAFTGQNATVTGLTSGQPYFLRIYANSNIAPVNGAFTVCITPGPTPPINDECATAIFVPVSTSCAAPTSGTVAASSQSLPPSATCGIATTANDVWYSFVASGSTQTITLNANFGSVIDIRSGTCATSTSVFCTTVFAFAAQGTVVTGLTNGQTYFMRIYANSATAPLPANSTFTLCLTAGPPPSANDECATAVAVAVVQSCATSTNGTVASATQSLPPTTSCGANVTTAADVWYSFVAASPTQLITLTPRFAAVLDVRSGACASSTSLLCTSVFANSATGTVVGGLTGGQTYFIRIYANGATQPTTANATFTLCINPAPTPPANDECSGAITVPVTATCTAPVSGTVEAASQSLPGTTGCGTAGVLAQDVWYQFVASGPTQIVNLNATFAAVLDVRSGTCATSVSQFCAPVFGNSSTIVGGLTNGQTYFIRLYASGTIQPTPLNASFTICINPGPTPPVNDECATSIFLPVTATCSSPTSGTVAAASQSLPPTTGCGGTTVANDVWYNFTASAATQSITLSTPQFSAVLDVRSGTCATSTSLFCTTSFVGQSRTTAVGGLTPGQTYFIRVYGFNPTSPTGATATFTLCVTPAPTPPVNDDCAGAITVPVQFGTTCVSQTTSDNTAATGSNVGAPGCASYQGGDVWFKAIVPPSGALTVRTVIPTTGTDIGDTGMSIYSGTCASLNLLGCDDDGAGALKSLLALTGRTPGEELYIRVWGFNNAIGTVAVCVTSPIICAVPTALPLSGITTTSAQISWQPGGTPATGTSYTVEYGLQGFTLGNGTTLANLTSPTVQLTGLLPSTTYCYYVRQNCPGGAGNSTYVGPNCFTTLAAPVCAVPTGATSASITATGAQLSWQPGGTPATGTTYTIEYGLQGFTPGNGTTVAALISPSFALSGLNSATDYCYYVRQNCPTPAGSSAFVGPVCFRTLTTTTAPANDDPCGAVTLGLTATGSPLQPITGTTFGATTSNQPGIVLPACSPATTPQDVWFAMTPAAGITSIRLIITGSAAGTVRVFTAPNCTTGPFTLVSCLSSGASNTAVGPLNLTGLVPGQRYYIAVSGYGNTDLAGAFTIAGATITAARVQMEANSLIVYPNPSNTGQLTMRISGIQGSSQATLLNALGQVVLTKALPSGSTEQVLSTRGLATGLYTLRVLVGDEVLTRKIVLE